MQLIWLKKRLKLTSEESEYNHCTNCSLMSDATDDTSIDKAVLITHTTAATAVMYSRIMNIQMQSQGDHSSRKRSQGAGCRQMNCPKDRKYSEICYVQRIPMTLFFRGDLELKYRDSCENEQVECLQPRKENFLSPR